MSTTSNDGGPAFPVSPPPTIPNGYYYHAEAGMTLRDYFAAAALQGLLASPDTVGTAGFVAYAYHAYQYADAMLAERAKTKGSSA
jgi:hypothetical protein